MSAFRIDRAVFRRSAVGLLVAMAGLGLTPAGWPGAAAPAAAQTKDLEARAVVVTAPEVSIRCGAGDVWYPIGQAKAGDVLTVDGESFGWLRVQYPPNVRALVPPDEGELVQGRGMVRLTKPSSLFAYNPHADVRDSWKRLLSEKLTPGTDLKHVQTLHDASGRLAGYLVAAPAGSRGYVSEQSVRRATDEEIAAAKARQQQQAAAAPAPAGNERKPVVNGPLAPSQTPVVDAMPTPGATTPESAAPAERPLASAPATTTDVDETMRGADDGGATEWEAPAETTTTTTAVDAPGEILNAPQVAPPGGGGAEAAAEREVATFAQLDRAFKAVIDEPIEGSELSPLIAEHQRLRASLPDTEENVSMRRAIDARIELLQLRLDLQATLQKLAQVEESASKAAEEVSKRVAEFASNRQYVVVGRLMASSVYNGERLPLMYRLISVDSGAGRTVAYVAPDDAVDLKGKLGSIVGVEGDGRMDPALRLNIIHPKRVDVLTSAPTE